MSEATNAEGGGARRGGLGGRRLLAASLVLNAFLAAIILGFFVTGPSSAPEQRRGFGPPELRAMQRAVVDADAAFKNLSRDLEREARREFQATRDLISAARRELAAAARAEPFDLERFDIALADLRAAQSHRFTLADRGLRELMIAADAETRGRYADALIEIQTRREERWRRRMERRREEEG